MATTLDFAKLSQAAYAGSSGMIHNNRSGVSWNKKSDIHLTGFFAALYSTSDDNESVLAFRGSQTSARFDLAGEIQLANSMPPHQVSNAINYTRGVRKNYPNIILTGHSLGGALAILVAAALDLKAYTFNAPGVVDECVTFSVRNEIFQRDASMSRIVKAIQNCLANPNIRNYRVNGDPVNTIHTTGKPGGNTGSKHASSSRHDLLYKNGVDAVVAELNAGSPT